MKNIVLIGMMGCGKTTCAGLLQEVLGLRVVDTDAIIVEREKKTINEIFSDDGEEYFRILETQVAKELSTRSDLIIATGGGLPLREENRNAIRKNGVVFWLKRDPASTFESENMDGRPLAQDGQIAFVKRFEERAPLYEEASHYIITDFTSPEITVQCIIDKLNIDK